MIQRIMKTQKEQLKERGIKIAWVADKVGVSPSLLSMYLSGARTMPYKIKAHIELILA